MHEVSKVYTLNNTWMKYPKGMKVKLMALLESSILDIKFKSAIIEVPNRGSAFKYYSGSDTIISKSEDLTEDTIITFIPLYYLSEVTEEDKDRIIIWNLANKWSVYETDSYNKWRKEYTLKYGYDLHKAVYK